MLQQAGRRFLGWGPGLSGPQIYPNAIAIGPGHWMRDQTADKVPSRHWDPKAYAPDAYRYLYCWRRVLSKPAHFRRPLLIVESWNNTMELCAISYRGLRPQSKSCRVTPLRGSRHHGFRFPGA